jgi:hypothetical protein
VTRAACLADSDGFNSLAQGFKDVSGVTVRLGDWTVSPNNKIPPIPASVDGHSTKTVLVHYSSGEDGRLSTVLGGFDSLMHRFIGWLVCPGLQLAVNQ